MKTKIKSGIVFLILLISFSFASYNSLAYLGVDDAIVSGIGCIAGGILGANSCSLYEPPDKGYDCGICNEQDPNKGGDPFGKCTEYRCKAIGETCKYIPSLDNPTEEGFCADEGKVDNVPPKITSCKLVDVDTYEIQDLTANNCNLGELAINKHYNLILSTDKVGECRFSTIPNNDKLFDLPQNQIDNKVIRIMSDLVNGKDHFWPIYFNEGWTLQNINAWNNANVKWYVRCANFLNDKFSDQDYSFTFKVKDGIGDVDAPVILDFEPETSPQTYQISRNTENVNLRFPVSDFSGIQECRYSDKNVGFDQMQPTTCNEMTDSGYQGNFIKVCSTVLTGFQDGVNDFFFNCKDASENQNIAPIPYFYNVIKPIVLSLTINSPTQGQVIDGINDNLQARTSGGVNGASTCVFDYNKLGGGPSGTNILFESDTPGMEDKSLHIQKLDFFPEDGQYNINMKCTAIGDLSNSAQGTLGIEYKKPSAISIPTPPGQPPRQCQLRLLWTDLRGNVINNEIEEGTRIIAALQDVNCRSSGAPLDSEDLKLGLFEVDERGVLGNDEDDVTHDLSFPDRVRFGPNKNIVFVEWIARWMQDSGADGPNPKYVFRVLDSQLASNQLRVRPGTGTSDDGGNNPGESCTTSQGCNGIYDTNLVCANVQANCPNPQAPLDPALCGNNRLNAGESCDGSLLNGKSCRLFGFGSGNLRCKLDCTGFDINQCSSRTSNVAGEECEIENCPGIYNTNLVCIDLGGDNCPSINGEDADNETDDGIDNTGESSLIIAGLGPSGVVLDIRVDVFINLRGGPSNFGKDAECRFTDTYSNQLIIGTSTLLFPQVLNYAGDIVGGSTRYSKQIEFGIGQHELYAKCKDSSGKYTALQTIKFNVQIPSSQTLGIIRTLPSGNLGNNIAKLEAETQGGADNGNSVQCRFKGVSSNALFTEFVTAPKQQITGNRYKHSLIPTDFVDGQHVYEVQCTDRLSQTDSEEIRFTIQKDTTIPQIQQIISKGSIKFITLSEPATCEISTENNPPNNDDQWSEVSRDANNGAKQLINAQQSYYIRCRDQWGNQMDVVRINI